MRLLYSWYSESEDKKAPEIITSVSEIVDIDMIGIRHPEDYIIKGLQLRMGDVVIEATTPTQDVIQVILQRADAMQLLLDIAKSVCCDIGKYTSNIAYVNSDALNQVPETNSYKYVSEEYDDEEYDSKERSKTSFFQQV